MQKLVPTLAVVLQQQDPVRTLVEAISDTPSLLARWVKEAGRHYAERAQGWLDSASGRAPAVCALPGAWQCECGASFARRSYLPYIKLGDMGAFSCSPLCAWRHMRSLPYLLLDRFASTEASEDAS